jgi:hypothetical protein
MSQTIKPEETPPLIVEWSYTYRPTGWSASVRHPEKVAIPRIKPIPKVAGPASVIDGTLEDWRLEPAYSGSGTFGQ